MIEIICDKQNDTENQGETQDELFRLPKNVRQVGSPSGNNRIYIEDYVVTYLNYIARPGNTDVRGAILVGEKKQTKQGEAIFISGAVDAQNIEFDMAECQFSEEIWSDIYEQIKENFPDLSVVGWFLSRMGFSTAINESIEKLHIENFPGSDKVLYVSDSLESEDAFYVYEKGQMVKQKGYFIYYARNEQMQSYIIKKRGDDVGEQDTDIKRKDEQLIRNYREKNKLALENRNPNSGLAYVAGAFLALVVLAMSITIAGNYKKMRNMEVSLNRLELTAEASGEVDATAQPATIIPPDTSAAQVMADDSNVEVSSENISEAGISTEEAIVDVEPNSIIAGSTEGEITTADEGQTDANDVTEPPSATVNSQPVVSDGLPVVYSVRYGDTLTSIALEYYGSIEYVQDIMNANGIDEEDKIFDGQELVLPEL